MNPIRRTINHFKGTVAKIKANARKSGDLDHLLAGTSGFLLARMFVYAGMLFTAYIASSFLSLFLIACLAVADFSVHCSVLRVISKAIHTSVQDTSGNIWMKTYNSWTLEKGMVL